jgi:hypothetical protein
MELIKYDQTRKTSTVKLTDDELLDIHALLLGAVNTQQDYTALGVPEARLRDMKREVSRLIKERHVRQTADA